MSVNKQELYNIIRIKYDNNSATLEELADQFNLDEDFVYLLVNNLVHPSSEFDDSDYDSRKGKCTTCGTYVDGDDIPDNCTGDCGRDMLGYFSADYPETESGDPYELNFE